MYICIYVYMYICIHVYMYICTYVHVYICVHVHVHVYVYVYVYVYIHTHTYTRIPPPRPNWPTVGCLVLWCSFFFSVLVNCKRVCVCAVRSLLANRSRRDKRQRFGLLVFKLSFNSRRVLRCLFKSRTASRSGFRNTRSLVFFPVVRRGPAGSFRS